MPCLYPLFINLDNHKPLIVGGGKVAARKAAGLLAAGAASPRVISPTLDPAMPTTILHIPKPYHPSLLQDATLVFAATDNPAVNQQIALDCHERKIPVNRADDPDDSDFITPALHRLDDILIAISASGSPALAAKVRDAIAASLDPQLAILSRLISQSRDKIRSSTLTPSQRADLHRKIAAQGLDFLKNNPQSAFPNWIISLIENPDT